MIGVLCYAGAEVDHRLESEYREETHSAPSGVWSAGRLQEEVPVEEDFRWAVSRDCVFCSFDLSLVVFSEAAAKVMVELLGSYTEDNASQARVDAHRYDFLFSLQPFHSLSFWSVVLENNICGLLSQVHRPCPERPKHLSLRPSPDFETGAFPGGRTHPWCKKILFFLWKFFNYIFKCVETLCSKCLFLLPAPHYLCQRKACRVCEVLPEQQRLHWVSRWVQSEGLYIHNHDDTLNTES